MGASKGMLLPRPIRNKILYFAKIMKLTLTLQIIRDIKEMLQRINNIMTIGNLEKTNWDLSISIIVPTRNEEKNIGRLLSSIKPWMDYGVEVIVVDYKSRDHTKEIAKEFGARILEIDKPGVGYACYIATKYVQSDIIIRTDADVIFPPYILPFVMDIFSKNDEVLFVSTGQVFYDGDFTDNLLIFLNDKYIRKPWHTRGTFLAFRRDVLKKINFNPKLKVVDDHFFGLVARKIFSPKVFYYDYMKAILTSSRRIRKMGKLRYIIFGPYFDIGLKLSKILYRLDN